MSVSIIMAAGVNRGRTGSPAADATFPRVGGDTGEGGGGRIQSDASASRRLFKAREARRGQSAAASSVISYSLNRLQISSSSRCRPVPALRSR